MAIYTISFLTITSVKFGYISYSLIARSTMVKRVISRTCLFMCMFSSNTIVHINLRCYSCNYWSAVASGDS